MAGPRRPRAGPDRRRDIEALAAAFFARLAPNPQRKPEAIAAECLALAATFYRVCDDPTPDTAG